MCAFGKSYTKMLNFYREDQGNAKGDDNRNPTMKKMIDNWVGQYDNSKFAGRAVDGVWPEEVLTEVFQGAIFNSPDRAKNPVAMSADAAATAARSWLKTMAGNVHPVVASRRGRVWLLARRAHVGCCCYALALGCAVPAGRATWHALSDDGTRSTDRQSELAAAKVVYEREEAERERNRIKNCPRRSKRQKECCAQHSTKSGSGPFIFITFDQAAAAACMTENNWSPICKCRT